jgi:hypothetical protein
MLCAFFKRRHLARNSKMFRAAVSSIKSLASARRWIPRLYNCSISYALPSYPGQFFPAIFHFRQKEYAAPIGRHSSPAKTKRQALACVGFKGRIAGKVQGKCCFTHRRTGRQDNQGPFLPAVGYFIKVGKAAGHTGKFLIAVAHVLNALDGFTSTESMVSTLLRRCSEVTW